MTHGGHTLNVPRPPRLVDLRAYADGIGHVIPGRHETRHPCGEPVRAERFARPATAACPECVGWIESELREAWGK
jgi:hypothetical protein